MRKRSAVLAVLSNRLGKQAIAVQPVGKRVWRRESPILTLRRKVVGRRSDAAARDIEGTVRPKIGPAAIGGKRQIVIETDRQALRFRVLLRSRKLPIDMPLHPLIEQDQLRLILPELGNSVATSGSLYSAGQSGQIQTSGSLLVNHFVERAIQRVSDRADLLRPVRTHRTRGWLALSEKLTETQLQEPQLQRIDFLVLDILRLRADCSNSLLDRRRSQADAGPRSDSRTSSIASTSRYRRIPIKRAIRQIRARVVRLAIRDRMQRIQSDKADPAVLDAPNRKSLQIREVAASPIALGSQTVDADRDTCAFSVPLEEFRLKRLSGQRISRVSVCVIAQHSESAV